MLNRLLFAILLPALCLAQAPPQFMITTVVGNGTGGYSGDGGAAGNAELQLPFATVYAGGNLYIADQVNNRIRFVTAKGVAVTGTDAITTVAGNGDATYTGDGGSAGKAGLS